MLLDTVWGAPDEGLAAATVSVTGSFVHPSVAHACMEPNTTLAAWDAARGVVELWTSTQAPWFIAKEVSHLLGLDHDQVLCREVAVGGGFGQKSKASEHEVLAAALSRASGPAGAGGAEPGGGVRRQQAAAPLRDPADGPRPTTPG